ncbi:hypothetical protein AB0M42_13945 [Streptomyces sp. NPDC051784]|uniref:hypothetical protein n=1 Tax=Streptomyces sp. NPDC051784 TaxID=3155805 RepID=UPI0034307E36
MEEVPWSVHETDDLTSAQQEFASVLAARASAWPVDPLSTVLLPARYTPYRELLAYLDIDDPERNQGLLTVGAHFDGTAVRADRLHNQDFTLPDAPTEFSGFVRCFDIVAGERRHSYGFESHPPHQFHLAETF